MQQTLRRAKTVIKKLKRTSLGDRHLVGAVRGTMLGDVDETQVAVAATHSSGSELMALRRGTMGRLSPGGMLALGVRKALGGYTSAKDVAGILVDPRLHRWSVVSAELRLYSAVIASCRYFHHI